MTVRKGGASGLHGRLHLHYDVCPTWLEIALAHLIRAEEEHTVLLSHWVSGRRDEASRSLEAEFRSGMQAATAACTSLDALYANVKELIPIPDEMGKAWAKNRTPREAQVAEVLRRGFSMTQSSASRLRDVVTKIYDFRGLTVHPSPKTKEPVLHPDIGVGVEWRFRSFSFANVKEIVGGCLSITAQLIQRPKKTHKRVTHYCEGMRSRIEPLVVQWETRFGTLYAVRSS